MNPSLSTAHERTLTALADRIIPADAFPSAGLSGAVAFICRLLDRDLPQRWPEMTAGLDAIERLAQQTREKSFADLTSEHQDALLTQIEAGGDVDLRHFFAWLVELVNESYYADPGNGGNAGAASWAMVGYAPRVPGYDGGKPTGDA